MHLIQSESVTDIPTNSHDGQHKIVGLQPIDPYSLKQTVFITNEHQEDNLSSIMSEPQDQLDSIHPSKKKQTRFKSSHHQAIKTARSTLKRQTVSYERTNIISKDVTNSPLVKRAQTNITKSSILLPVKKYDLKIRMDTS